MRSLYILVFSLFLVSANRLFSQCKADSVITYRIVEGANRVAGIEYYTYDEKDSILKKTLVEIYEERARPLNETGVRYYKSGSLFCVEYESRTWVEDRGIYKPESRHTLVKNKKGQLVTERYDRVVSTTVTAESKSDYTYNKTGQLISNEFMRWNETTQSWEPVSKVSYNYTGALQVESYSYVWDTTQLNWTNDWHTVFSYDSLNELSETVSYHYKNDAWIPDSRTVYGKEPDKPVKWNIVQEWNGAKENWSNKYYYVFQLNESGLVQKEIHLDWVGKEWQINLTFQYVYNDAGLLVQILNGSNQVIMDRFCRN